MPSIKKNLCLLATLFLLGKKVNADDCSYVERAVNYLGNDFKNTYKVTNCCEFNGVTCDANNNVIELKFNNVNDQSANASKVFEKVANLKSLTTLELENDNLKIEFPKSLCSLTNLKNLNLGNNDISGTIPYDCKNLQNLEQIKLEGNPNLHGYIPILSKVRGCSYNNTGLCNLPNSTCKNAPKDCTTDDIKQTNAENGNPDPNSETYEGASSDRSMDVYDMGYDNSGYGYSSYGYDNGGYGSSGYGYDTNGYGDYGYGGGYYQDDYNSPFTSLMSAMLSCLFFGIVLFTCCACCLCRGACTPDYGMATTTTTTKPTSKPPAYSTHTTTTHTTPSTTVHHQASPYGPTQEADITSNANPYNLPPYTTTTSTTTNTNNQYSNTGYANNASYPQPQGGYSYPPPPMNYQNNAGYGNNATGYNNGYANNNAYGYGANRSVDVNNDSVEIHVKKDEN